MPVIKSNRDDSRKERSVKQIKHVLADVMGDDAAEDKDDFKHFGSTQQSLVRGLEKPSTTIQLGKIKPVISATLTPRPVPATPTQQPVSQPNLPPIDASLYEDEAAAYRVQAQAKIDMELSRYRDQALASIEQEKQSLLQQARQEGFQQGQQEGQQAYMEKAKGLFDAVNGIEHDRKASLERMEEDLLQLSVKIAETIVQKELSFDEDAIYSIVKEALTKITDKDKVMIKVNPSEVDKIRQRQNDILNLMPDIRSLQISGDERIKSGGCIIETKLGFVDSSISTKLETIEQALMDTYQEGMMGA